MSVGKESIKRAASAGAKKTAAAKTAEAGVKTTAEVKAAEPKASAAKICNQSGGSQKDNNEKNYSGKDCKKCKDFCTYSCQFRRDSGKIYL